jgi:N-acetylglucosamine kinase-like BadF-type ATPase
VTDADPLRSSAQGVLAIDAGQTGMKVRVRRGARTDDILFDGIRTHEPLLPQLVHVVRAAMAQTGLTPEIITAGISGLTDRDADAAALLALLDDNGIRDAVLAHDSTTSFLGALGDARGAVVASGTGVVTLAVGRDAIARVDGWGHIMGDAGSGYWIGREALDGVMRAFDGRGPHTSLTGVVRERWPDLAQAYIGLQALPDRVSVVASYAAHVARLAEEGDAVARQITRAAAHELALSVTTALDRVAHSDHDRFAVCAMGGVFRSRLLSAAFTEEMNAGVWGGAVDVVPPRGEGIDGAMALAGLSAAHPLSSAVHRATA